MQTDVERANPYEEGIETAIRAALALSWTSLPGQVVSFDPAKQTAAVAPTIQAVATAPDGTRSLVTMPLLLDCPVHFPEGGGAVFTFPVQPGDECLVVFADRCIDSWWQQGGIQPPAEFRMHDLSDGFVFVGFRSLPNVVTDMSMTSAEIRSLGGETRIALNPTGQTVEIAAPGGATINADVIINGDLTVTGTIQAAVDVVAAGVSLKTHKHGGVTVGAAQTGIPA